MKRETSSSLGRIFHHANGNSNIAMLTAFRNPPKNAEGYVTPQDAKQQRSLNFKRNKILEAEIKASGYGYVKTDGSYLEEIVSSDGSVDKVQVFERSFAVFAEPTQEAGEALLKLATKLGKKFGQDSILFKPYSEKYAYWYFTGSSQAGEIERVGTWTPIIMTAYYSQLLNTKQKFQFR